MLWEGREVLGSVIIVIANRKKNQQLKILYTLTNNTNEVKMLIATLPDDNTIIKKGKSTIRKPFDVCT